MNTIIKEKVRELREEIKTLNLKKESLTDKVNMQTQFIEEIELRGKENIKEKKEKVEKLGDEIGVLMRQNEQTEDNVYGLTEEQKNVTGSADKLRKFSGLKGKISNKVSMITKEHKFFTENKVCPTCTQSIEEEFRINKIEDAQDKA